MNIDGIKNGVVLDHITAGKAMDIYRYLNLDAMDCCVAIIKNVDSARMGKKDILKIDADLDMDLEMLGFLDPGITVNFVRNEALAEKTHLSPPGVLRNVIRCKNPRCITTTEQEIEHVFTRDEDNGGVYRCLYCEAAHSGPPSEL